MEVDKTETEIKEYEKIDTIRMYLDLYLNHVMSKKTMIEKADLGYDEIMKRYKIDTIRMYLDLYRNKIISQKIMIEKTGLNYEKEIKRIREEMEEGEKIYQERFKEKAKK